MNGLVSEYLSHGNLSENAVKFSVRNSSYSSDNVLALATKSRRCSRIPRAATPSIAVHEDLGSEKASSIRSFLLNAHALLFYLRS